MRQLAGARARGRQLLRACAIGKLRLPLQLRDQRNRFALVARRQARRAHRPGFFENFPVAGRIAADALDRYRCHCAWWRSGRW